MPAISTRIQDHFEELTDPRRREPLYPLMTIVTIAISAVVCGALPACQGEATGGIRDVSPPALPPATTSACPFRNFNSAIVISPNSGAW